MKYDKLVRDRIPEIIEGKGSHAVVEVLDESPFKWYLDEKLLEELREYQEDGSVGELADLVEVVYAILDSKGISVEEFKRIGVSKAEEHGGFQKKLIFKRSCHNVKKDGDINAFEFNRI